MPTMPKNGSEDELRKYEQGWTKEMCYYWRERMQRLMIRDTGALFKSVTGVLHEGETTTIEHSFLRYGIQVAAGVGPAHKWKLWGNNAKNHGKMPRARIGGGGQLEFLDPAYRKEHGLDDKKKVGPRWGGRVAGGEPKGRRDWFSKKYYSSVMRLNEFEAAYYGVAWQGLMATALDEMFGHKGDARWL